MAAAAACLAAALLAACSHKSAAPPPPTATTAEPAVTAPPTTVAATVVTAPPGRPRDAVATEPADIQGGGARINGSVVGPQGNVPGATVRVERYVGDQVGTVTATTNATGQYSLTSVRGGSYRLQAWKTPDLLLLDPEAFFLAADETKTIDLRAAKLADVNVRSTVTPDPLPVQDPFAVTVFLFAATVSDEGALQATPRTGEGVQIVAGSGLGLSGTDRAVTDSGGNVTFRARCLTPGPASADLLVSTLRFKVDLPPCRS